VVISAPSGGGKNSVILEIMNRRPEFRYNVSTTSRVRRDYEKEGEHYHFIGREEFQDKIDNGHFIEWADVHGELYGTERKGIEDRLKKGETVLLDLDVQGGAAVQKICPDCTIAVFLHAPSVEVLRRRLTGRGSENSEAIDHRLERYTMEKAEGEKYPFQIVNDDFETTIQQLLQIIDSNHIGSKQMIEKVNGEDPSNKEADDSSASDGTIEIKNIEETTHKSEEPSPIVEEPELVEPELIEDFKGIAGSVYEAAMIASRRSRQIGRNQKDEIDAWNKSLESTMIEEELSDEPMPYREKREFNFPKPIIKALAELKSERFDFHYKEDKK